MKTCLYCQTELTGQWQKKYCSLTCSAAHKRTSIRLTHCRNCNKPLESRWQKQFCSKSCSAIYNNTKIPKRSKTRIYRCVDCNKKIRDQRKYCKSCLQSRRATTDIRYMDLSKMSMSSLKKEYSHHPSHKAHHKLRKISNAIYKTSDKPQCCVVCGYDLHFEVAHIVAVSSFPDDTPLSIVNALDNLIALCRNHHWEYDHGHLDLSLYL